VKARDAQLSCTSCHGAHRFDTKKAAVEACTGCHRDGHTAAYERSPHHALWKKELAGELPPGSGVSCASCHLPRDEYRAPDLDAKRVLVQHNQSDNLRPSEKMIRPVCMSCHGLGFSTDALADAKLVQDNFLGQPRARVKSLEMVGLCFLKQDHAQLAIKQLSKGLSQIDDESQLRDLIQEALGSNADAVAQYRAGKASALGFLVGRVMKATAGKANPKRVNDLLKKALDSG